MSQVTMCDFCGGTSRDAASVKKVELPVAIVPEPLRTIGVTGDGRKLDACPDCQAELGLLLDELVTRRLGITDHTAQLRCPACGSDHVRIPGAPTALPGQTLDTSQVAAECGACPTTGTVADFTRTIEHG